jgi:hypothetical protein
VFNTLSKKVVGHGIAFFVRRFNAGLRELVRAGKMLT